MNHHKKAFPKAYRWLLPAFLVGAALFAILMAVAAWPLWLSLFESDAGRFEQVFGRAPPAGAHLLDSVSEYGDGFEQVAVVFQLAEADFRVFLPDGFHPLAPVDLTDRTGGEGDAGALSNAAKLHGCKRLEGWRRAPWPSAGLDVVSQVEVLYCADSAMAHAAARAPN